MACPPCRSLALRVESVGRRLAPRQSNTVSVGSTVSRSRGYKQERSVDGCAALPARACAATPPRDGVSRLSGSGRAFGEPGRWSRRCTENPPASAGGVSILATLPQRLLPPPRRLLSRVFSFFCDALSGDLGVWCERR